MPELLFYIFALLGFACPPPLGYTVRRKTWTLSRPPTRPPPTCRFAHHIYVYASRAIHLFSRGGGHSPLLFSSRGKAGGREKGGPRARGHYGVRGCGGGEGGDRIWQHRARGALSSYPIKIFAASGGHTGIAPDQGGKGVRMGGGMLM